MSGVNWADVTLREYDALHALALPDLVARHDAYARDGFTAGRWPFATEPPTLTAEGREHVAALQSCYAAGDDRQRLAAARSLLLVLGALTVMRIARGDAL